VSLIYLIVLIVESGFIGMKTEYFGCKKRII
jgi:hypothetical protein